MPTIIDLLTPRAASVIDVLGVVAAAGLAAIVVFVAVDALATIAARLRPRPRRVRRALRRWRARLLWSPKPRPRAIRLKHVPHPRHRFR